MNWLARRQDWDPAPDDARSPGDVDYGRVIHSASFRRLQGKTQILNLGDGDFYRTRLTHSLEVAQIAGALLNQLLKSSSTHPAPEHICDRSMIQAIGCSHDLGHPPFGHGGEIALNYCMRDHGGFEANGQTLRILSRLERFSNKGGANLTRRTLLGILKYPVSYSILFNPVCAPSLESSSTTIKVINRKQSMPPKCFLASEKEIVDWILRPIAQNDRDAFQNIERSTQAHHKAIHKSFDCSIMDIADDIAYGVHDLEDALALKLVTEKRFRELVLETTCLCLLETPSFVSPGTGQKFTYENFVNDLFGDSGKRKGWIGRLVGHFVLATTIDDAGQFQDPMLRFAATMPQAQKELLQTLKDLVKSDVIQSPRVQHLEFKGQMMVVAVFEALQTDPQRLLPEDVHGRFSATNHDPRVICDYIAGMTDHHLLRTYDRLFSPRMGSVFDQL